MLFFFMATRARTCLCGCMSGAREKSETNETRTFKIQQNCSLLSPSMEERRIPSLPSCCAKNVDEVFHKWEQKVGGGDDYETRIIL